MFPICNDLGEVIAFSGRVLAADAKAAKYVNSPETPLFKKGDVLFGLHKSKRALIDRKSAIVLEGQIDLITAFEAGVQNVVAPQGTAFTEKQARTLKRYVEEVVLCFDADEAGRKAAERSLPALARARPGRARHRAAPGRGPGFADPHPGRRGVRHPRGRARAITSISRSTPRPRTRNSRRRGARSSLPTPWPPLSS